MGTAGTVRRELLVLAFFLVATAVLTWPIPASLASASGMRGDYFNNLWNFWWVKRCVVELESPFSTDFLYYPMGISLKRHTLSPLNAATGAALSSFLDLHTAYNLVLMLTFALSGWTFSLFAREATGSLAGGILGGLYYSFNPYHYSYLCQINVFTLEFLPLALLFLVRCYRRGRVADFLGAVFSIGAIAATHEYYVIYAFLIGGLVVLGGRLLDRAAPWRAGASRVALALVAAAVMVALVSLPLLIGTFGPEGAEEGLGEFSKDTRRANDLLGYNWIGGPETATISWPTMLGFVPLLVLLVTCGRWLRRQTFWVLIGTFFFVLSLGETLVVAGKDTGMFLPYALFAKLPGLAMLRKPDRCFVIVQLVAALCLAESWAGLSERLRSTRTRALVWAALAGLVMLELTGVPFQRFDYEPPAYLHELERHKEVEAIVELPPMDIDVMNARYLLYQTVHEKKQPLGYCTALATSKRHNDQMQHVINGYLEWIDGATSRLSDWIRGNRFDLVLHYKTMPEQRDPDPRYHQRVLWQPFFFLRKGLVGMRQAGQYQEMDLDDKNPLWLPSIRGRLIQEYGRPLHEDDEVMVFRVEKRDE